MIPDQVYLWGWPQWVMLGWIGGNAAVHMRERLDHFGDPDRATLKLLLNIALAIVLGAGGFWS